MLFSISIRISRSRQFFDGPPMTANQKIIKISMVRRDIGTREGRLDTGLLKIPAR